MPTQTHTPGPWHIEFDFILSGEGALLATVHQASDKKLEANARLLSKAWAIPQLVEALRAYAKRRRKFGGLLDEGRGEAQDRDSGSRSSA